MRDLLQELTELTLLEGWQYSRKKLTKMLLRKFRTRPTNVATFASKVAKMLYDGELKGDVDGFVKFFSFHNDDTDKTAAIQQALHRFEVDVLAPTLRAFIKSHGLTDEADWQGVEARVMRIVGRRYGSRRLKITHIKKPPVKLRLVKLAS